MYRTDFWTLWEEASVGCFERTACILSIVKQITSPGGMHETSAWAWLLGRHRGIGWRGRWEGGSGWGIHVYPWLIHVNVWQNPLKCCEVISLQLIKINEKKKKKNVSPACTLILIIKPHTFTIRLLTTPSHPKLGCTVLKALAHSCPLCLAKQ